jgi:UPF0716 protein FxsA
MRFLFFFFVAIPVVEMYLLLKVGALIGAAPTIGLVVLTAMIGSYLLKQQGVATLTNAQARMNSGEIPATELFEGMFLAVGGALLLTPGFVTDVIGFACLVPFTRKLMIEKLVNSGVVQMRAQNGFTQQSFYSDSTRQPPFSQPTQDNGAQQQRSNVAEDGRGHVIIEGDFDKEEPK